ncbi:hypothetical protein ACU635_38440 [[Actinomadura] parvosata]|uniref:hypothetical protein n=1 Tax=[Actinomadura] parvosata TaxID=1955412 RepID=UPI00406C5A7F
MAAPSEEDRVRRVLHALIELLERVGQPHASCAQGLRRLDSRDVVLMNAQGVLPEQDECYELRGQLFEAARDELRQRSAGVRTR